MSESLACSGPCAHPFCQVFRQGVRLRHALAETADQLERWAEESRHGGWSTHQVDPMLVKAREIWQLLGRLDRAVQVAVPAEKS